MKQEAWILKLDTVPYLEALELQKKLVELRSRNCINDTLILLEHTPVFTVTREATRQNLLASPQALAAKGIAVHRTNRGGDITYHGPGQLVGYPIISLKDRGKDLHRYIRTLEEVIILVLQEYGIHGYRDSINAGVWVEGDKIAAIGIAVKSSWTTMHGFSFNISPDLSHYSFIVPCGIVGRGVTSLTKILGRPVGRKEVQGRLIHYFEEVFDVTSREVSLDQLQNEKCKMKGT
jgi:lipoate-protein ligase B